MQVRANKVKKTTRAAKAALVFLCLLFLLSCSVKTRQIFFDIQPPTAAEIAEKNRQENARREAVLAEAAGQMDSKALAFGDNSDNRPRPDLESVTSWEQALELLPKDYKKKADWAAAVEQGLIRPRAGADPNTQYVKTFQYDFIMPAEKPKNEAYFPHSAHTQWLSCKNCHMTIFPYKRNPATMKEMKKGASCGACHGKKNVAFSLSNCKRCHLKR